jgi:hypothetical protein
MKGEHNKNGEGATITKKGENKVKSFEKLIYSFREAMTSSIFMDGDREVGLVYIFCYQSDQPIL